MNWTRWGGLGWGDRGGVLDGSRGARIAGIIRADRGGKDGHGIAWGRKVKSVKLMDDQGEGRLDGWMWWMYKSTRIWSTRELRLE